MTGAQILQAAIAVALGSAVPRNDVEKALLEILKEAAKDPSLAGRVVEWLHRVQSGEAPLMPLGLSPRASSDFLAHLQLAEGKDRKGMADLFAAIVGRIIDLVFVAAAV